VEDTAVFVDGARLAGDTVALPLGRHFVYLLAPGKLPAAHAVEVAGDQPLTFQLSDAGADAQLGTLRLRLELGVRPSRGELALAAAHFGVDAAIAIEPGDDWQERVRAAAGTVASECHIGHVAPERTRARRPLALEFRVGRCVAGVRARVATPAGSFALEAPRREERATLTLPAASLPLSDRPYAIQYNVWGETLRGNPLGGPGSETSPLRILVESDPIPRWYRKWWVWTLAGIATAGVVVIPSVVVTRPPPTTGIRLVGSGAN
jgi:hypothetical protein